MAVLTILSERATCPVLGTSTASGKPFLYTPARNDLSVVWAAANGGV